MNFGLDLNMNVGLEQKLSPQMIQSLKLLQMNSMELELVVKQELETNPLLEPTEDDEPQQEAAPDDEVAQAEERVAEPIVEAPSPETAEERESQTSPAEAELDKVIPEDTKDKNEIDWETYLEDGFDMGDKRTEELESPDERFEKVPVYSKTLQDHLLGQLQDRTIPPEVEPLVEYLINSLDERGYLVPESKIEPEPEEEEDDDIIGKPAPAANPASPDPMRKAPESGTAAASLDHASDPSSSDRKGAVRLRPQSIAPEIAEPIVKEMQAIIDGSLDLDAASPRVREALHVLQSLDPSGIGARNLRECLLLQIYRYGRVSPLAKRIVEEEFELLEKLKVAAIAKKLDQPPELIQAAMKEIGALEPHPGRQVSASMANPITPDLIVEEVDGELVLMLNDRTVPSLKVSRAYAELLKKGSKASTEEKKYVREKLNSATWLIRAIEQRKSTMLKVMQAIIESQPDFFKEGPTHLRPLILQDVADKIGMHISTVSRVTNGKYVQTSHGIFELKYFFTAGVTQADGREISSVTTKDEIKKLIESEDTKRPLSDQKIVEILKAKGLDVARRTVAKYRDQLEILPARLRKQY